MSFSIMNFLLLVYVSVKGIRNHPIQLKNPVCGTSRRDGEHDPVFCLSDFRNWRFLDGSKV